ncbi:MAG: hypothetical protein ACOYNC_13780 [Bacteroidales bacterium]
MTNIPVLFITFARPDYARKAFEAIKIARPGILYFYSNKARHDRPDEIERNEQIRAFINEVTWKCELYTFFREEHVDVYTSLWSAIDWIFSKEELAIILEEDCVASIAFFNFCEQLLPQYRDDNRIWVISGNNLIEGYNPNNYDYFFSYFPYMYGWASWQNRWQKVIRDRLPYEKIKEYHLFDQIYIKPTAVKQALKFTEKIVNTPAWDYRFTISMKCNGAFGIIPKVNLVSNIGISGVHNSGTQSLVHNRILPDFDKYVITNPPPFIVADYGYSKHWFDTYYIKRNKLFYKIKRRLGSIIKKSLSF